MSKRQNKQLMKLRREMARVSKLSIEPKAIEGDIDPARFVNRELSLLEFQRRVLEEAQNEQGPLLERVKFLAIFYSNMSEVFMIRVAGIKKQIQAGITDRSADGLTPSEQLAAIRTLTVELFQAAEGCLRDNLQPKLTAAGVRIWKFAELDKNQKKVLRKYYDEMIFPVLTPLAHDPSRPFPHISNLSMNLAVMVRDSRGLLHFARIKVPESLPALISLDGIQDDVARANPTPRGRDFIWLEEVIVSHLDSLFPGQEILEVYPFHVTRDADVEIQELEASDLLSTIEEGIRKRRFGSVVRLIVNHQISADVRRTLVEKMGITKDDVYTIENPFGWNHLMNVFSAVDRPDLKFPQYPLMMPAGLRNFQEQRVFDCINAEDIWLHHPYDSFMPVIEFLWAAATDPTVVAIKQTLYRVGTNAQIVEALLSARRNGKQVTVLVELKARFDEESNIEWARMLENEGVHVVYGLLGLKTHCKVALVIRKENHRMRYYAHIGTGNYNDVTAQQYEDLGLFTADQEIGADVTHLLNYLTGYSDKSDYKKLLVAPLKMRWQFEQLIRREIDHAKAGQKAHLILKTNALADRSIIHLLYEASAAGVTVDLIVRGICCLRPGIPGVSDKIRVISVLGRYLEHSRIYYFHNNGDPTLLIGSADLMQRNLNLRVEVMLPVMNQSFIRYLRNDVLETYLNDNVRARLMTPTGSYVRRQRGENEPAVDVQDWLLNNRASRKN